MFSPSFFSSIGGGGLVGFFFVFWKEPDSKYCFVGHAVSVTTIQFCHCSSKAEAGNV